MKEIFQDASRKNKELPSTLFCLKLPHERSEEWGRDFGTLSSAWQIPREDKNAIKLWESARKFLPGENFSEAALLLMLRSCNESRNEDDEKFANSAWRIIHY